MRTNYQYLLFLLLSLGLILPTSTFAQDLSDLAEDVEVEESEDDVEDEAEDNADTASKPSVKGKKKGKKKKKIAKKKSDASKLIFVSDSNASLKVNGKTRRGLTPDTKQIFKVKAGSQVIVVIGEYGSQRNFESETKKGKKYRFKIKMAVEESLRKKCQEKKKKGKKKKCLANLEKKIKKSKKKNKKAKKKK